MNVRRCLGSSPLLVLLRRSRIGKRLEEKLKRGDRDSLLSPLDELLFHFPGQLRRMVDHTLGPSTTAVARLKLRREISTSLLATGSMHLDTMHGLTEFEYLLRPFLSTTFAS